MNVDVIWKIISDLLADPRVQGVAALISIISAVVTVIALIVRREHHDWAEAKYIAGEFLPPILAGFCIVAAAFRWFTIVVILGILIIIISVIHALNVRVKITRLQSEINKYAPSIITDQPQRLLPPKYSKTSRKARK